ncbi:tyrosine-type recombinase/integrase [Chromobacterium sphagni]|nr:integrase family protein [Chromobacterium sphagni]
MSRNKFTIKFIEEAVAPAGKAQVFFWDSEAPGLGLRVSSSGSKAFIFQSRIHGEVLRITIGDIKTWRLDGPTGSQENNARKEARRLQTLCDAGVDPRQEKLEKKAIAQAKKQAKQREKITVAEVWPCYVEANAGRWSAKHLLSHQELATAGGEKKKRGKGERVAGPLASLMTQRLVDVTSELLSEWAKQESAKRPTATALSFRIFRAFLNWCDEQPKWAGLVPGNAHRAKQVRMQIPKPKAKQDCLQKEQLASWFAAVKQIDNIVISAYLQALLLTGARREELAELKWTDVDFKWNSLVLRDKVEGERIIPLTEYVSSLMQNLPRRNEWVFSSDRSSSGRITEPRIAHKAALKDAGLPDLSLHGLRRSFGTLAEWVECPTGVVAQIMGHKPSATAEKHYRRRSLDLLRHHHVRIEGWILEQVQR